MCNCRNKVGFDLAMSQASKFESNSNRKAAVFVRDGKPSFTEESNINKIEGICCYFTTDGIEHQIIKDEPVEVVEKAIEEIEVISEEVKPKKAKRKRTKS